MNKKILSIILIFSLISNLILGLCLYNTITTHNKQELKEELIATIEASDNSIEILSFYKNQLEMETVTKNDYSVELKELSDIHLTLINLLQQKDYKSLNDLKDKTLLFLNERKKIFDNLKSAIDLDSSNYYNVAATAEEQANKLLAELNLLLK